MLRKLQLSVLFFLIISTICVDLRLAGFNIIFAPGAEGVGMPRLTEVLTILFVAVSVSKVKLLGKNQIWIILFMILMSLFALFKPFYAVYLRSAIILPMTLLIFLSLIKLEKKVFVDLLLVIFYATSVSSLFVLISTHVDFGVTRFYANAEGVERYIGFGQSLPYQACYSLMSIPLFSYLQKNKSNKIIRNINLICLFVNIMAILLTGARTAYVILFLLGLLYCRQVIKRIQIWHIVVLSFILIYSIGYFYSTISELLSARNEFELAGRDEVWKISLMLIINNPILGITNYFEEGKQFGNVLAHSQNGFFEIYFWGGLFGFIFSMWIYTTLYKSYGNDNVLKELCKGIFIVFMIFMITEILFFSVQAYYQFILITGLIYAYSKSNALNNNIKSFN